MNSKEILMLESINASLLMERNVRSLIYCLIVASRIYASILEAILHTSVIKYDFLSVICGDLM